MIEQLTYEDITIQVRGFFYKIPYYVLADDEDIFYQYGYTNKIENEAQRENMTLKLRNMIYGGDGGDTHRVVAFVKGMVALKPEQYYSYRYVKLNDHDDDREAMLAYVAQFENEGTLIALKRELAFFAGMQYRDLQTQKNKHDGVQS